MPIYSHLILFCALILIPDILHSNSISGRVIENRTGEPLVGANITIVETNRGTASDRNGFFRIEGLPDGDYILRVQYVGYTPVIKTISLPAIAEFIEIVMKEQSYEIDEVIVTASPLRSAVGYQAAQSLQGDAIHRLAASSIGEMLEFEPGLAMRSFGSAPARPVIRGLDGDRVLVLENGERMGDLAETAHDHAIAIDPLAAHKIEIVRGPASLLYGSSALGGVVNIFTEDIPENWSPGVSGTAAMYGASMNNEGAGFGRIVYGGSQWASAFSLSYRESGDIRTPDGLLPGTSIRNLAGSGGIGYRGGRSSGGAAITYLDKVYGLPEEIDDPDEEIEIRMDRFAMQGKADWQMDGFFRNIELRMSGTRYLHQEIEIEHENGIADEEVELDFLQHSLSSTITIVHSPISILSEGAIGFTISFRNLSVGGIEALNPDGRSFAAGLFLFEEILLTEHLRLQFGSRIETHRILTRPNEKFPAAESLRMSGTFSGSTGLNYRPLPAIEFGIQAARAHRTPTIEELYSNAPHLGTGAYEIGDADLRNEIGHGFDAFGKYRGENFRIEAAAFYNRISDFIFLQPTGDIHEPSGLPVFRYRAGNTEFAGGEIDISSRILNVVRIDGQASYVRGTQLGTERTPLPFMPPLRGKIGIMYDVPNWWIGTTVQWVRTQSRVAEGETATDGYTLLNLELGYRMHYSGRHLIMVRFDNVFDTVYRDHLSRVQDRDNPMPGRNANVIYRWYF